MTIMRKILLLLITILTIFGNALAIEPPIINIYSSENPDSVYSGQSVTIHIQVNGGGCFLLLNSGMYPNCVPSGQVGMINYTITAGGSGIVSGDIQDVGDGGTSHFQYKYANYEMNGVAQCKLGEDKWSGGGLVQECKLVNHVPTLVDKESCQYGVVGDGSGGWKCADNPMPTNVPKSTPGFQLIYAILGIVLLNFSITKRSRRWR